MFAIIDSLPKGRSKLADQLSRASLSICANIAEGAGEFSGDAKASFYRIACRSATECAAILDASNKSGIADEHVVNNGRAKLNRIRRRGVARALVDRVVAEAHESGLGPVELLTWAFNEGARTTFARMGFTPTVTRYQRTDS